jgi:AcrR family transcriptional regulator
MARTQPLRRGDLRDALVAYARCETDAGRIDAMSLRGAARDLGVSSGAVYRHFADKDALLCAIAWQGFIELRALFTAIRPQGAAAPSPEVAVGRAYAMGRAFVGFANRNPTLWRMMMGRIGVMCRDRLMADPELSGYTLLDCSGENCRDLWRLGAIPDEPDIEDIRFMWAAAHGAADLLQSGLREDAGCCGADDLADQTTERSLRALGCPRDLVRAGRPPVTAAAQ